MAITRFNISFDATWCRGWLVDTFLELDELGSTWAAPLGPKRGDVAFCSEGEPNQWFMFLNDGLYEQFTGFASLPIHLESQVDGRLPYANFNEVNGPALIGKFDPGLGDANQGQPNNAGDILQYDGTDLIFGPITDNSLFYEEGDWTPTISFGGASVGITYSQNTGRYVRLGNLIIVTGGMVLSNKGSSVGAASIAGLPFQVGNATKFFSTATVDYSGFAAGVNSPYLVAIVGTQTMVPKYGTAVSGTQLTNTEFTNSSALLLGGLAYLRT